jgi:hypothetical protein
MNVQAISTSITVRNKRGYNELVISVRVLEK